MTRNREFLKWAWPRLGTVILVDFLLAMGIMGLANAIALVTYREFTARARMTEVWVGAGAQRMRVIESLALSGESFKVVENARGTKPSASFSDTPAGRTSIHRIVDDAIITTISPNLYGGHTDISGGKANIGAYEFVLRPAVADVETPSVYLWLCGNQNVPHGWVAKTPLTRGNAPVFLLPTDCRRENIK